MPCLADVHGMPTDVLAELKGEVPTVAGGDTLTGYAAVFFQEGDPTTVGITDDGHELRILPGAFDLALRKPTVRALYDHDRHMSLGGVADGSLRLWLDSRGLRFALTVPSSGLGRGVLRGVQTGRLTGASFCGAYRLRHEFEENGRRVREVYDSSLTEISVVEHPRFSGCGVAIASGRADADDVAIFLATMANEARCDGQ